MSKKTNPFSPWTGWSETEVKKKAILNEVRSALHGESVEGTAKSDSLAKRQMQARKRIEALAAMRALRKADLGEDL